MVATCSVPSGQAVAVESPETMAAFDSTDVIQQQNLCARIISGCKHSGVGDAHGGANRLVARDPWLREQDLPQNLTPPVTAPSIDGVQNVGTVGSYACEADMSSSPLLTAASALADSMAGSSIASRAQVTRSESSDASCKGNGRASARGVKSAPSTR